MCGKALPFRQRAKAVIFVINFCPAARKGEAFPHITPAKPRLVGLRSDRDLVGVGGLGERLAVDLSPILLK